MKQVKFSFGFKGDLAKFKKVINALINEIELVNRDFSTSEELIHVLTAKNIKPFSTKIQLGCETTTFRYVVEKLKFQFHNLTFSTTGSSGLFNSKNANPITAQNLFSSKLPNYKNSENIDEIIANL